MASAALVISNTAPEVSDVVIAPDPAYADDTHWNAVGPLAITTMTSTVPPSSWTVDGTTAGTDTALSDAFLGGQEVTCTVTANDGTDTGTVASGTVVITNTAPELASAILSPEEAYEGDILNCTPGETTDIDGTTDFSYSYAWQIDGNAQAAPPMQH